MFRAKPPRGQDRPARTPHPAPPFARPAWTQAAVGASGVGGGTAVIASHIDMGLPVRVIDMTPFRARASVSRQYDEAFL